MNKTHKISILLFIFSLVALGGCSLVTGFKEYSFGSADGDSDADTDGDYDAQPDTDETDADADEDDGSLPDWNITAALVVRGCGDEPGCVCFPSDENGVCAINPRGWQVRDQLPHLWGGVRVEFAFDSPGVAVDLASLFAGDELVATIEYTDPVEHDEDGFELDTAIVTAGDHPITVEFHSVDDRTHRVAHEVQISEALPCGEVGFHHRGKPVDFNLSEALQNFPSTAVFDDHLGVAWIDDDMGAMTLRLAQFVPGESVRFAQPLPINTSGSKQIGIAAFEGGYAVVWDEHTGEEYQVFLMIYNRELETVLSDPLIFGRVRYDADVDITLGDDEFGVVWSDRYRRDVKFVSVTFDGVIQHGGNEGIGISRADSDWTPYQPKIAWDQGEGEYWVVWRRISSSSRAQIQVNRFGPGVTDAVAGTPVSPPGSDYAVTPTIAWAGEHLGIVFVTTDPDGNYTYAFRTARSDFLAVALGPLNYFRAVEGTATAFMYPSLAWSGYEFVVSLGYEYIELIALSVEGQVFDNVPPIVANPIGSQAFFSSVEWYNFGYSVSWFHQPESGGQATIVTQDFDLCR